MSIGQVLEDVVTGQEAAALAKIETWWSGLQPEFQALVTTLATDAGKILQGLVTTAAQDVIAGGLTTASFVSAAKDVESKLVSQGVALGTQTVYAALNAVVAANAPSTAEAT